MNDLGGGGDEFPYVGRTSDQLGELSCSSRRRHGLNQRCNAIGSADGLQLALGIKLRSKFLHLPTRLGVADGRDGREQSSVTRIIEIFGLADELMHFRQASWLKKQTPQKCIFGFPVNGRNGLQQTRCLGRIDTTVAIVFFQLICVPP